MKSTYLLRIIATSVCISILLNACSGHKGGNPTPSPVNISNAALSDFKPPELTSASVKGEDEAFKIIIASDVHVFFSHMHDNSDTFKDFEANSASKLLTYSDHIMGAFVYDVLTERPDAVILSGDLTLNGEKLGHEALAAWLSKITDAGIQVLVIPGNHDINNPFAREIHGGQFSKTAYVSSNEFAEIYAPYGYAEPAYRDEASLSYITPLNDYLYAVMLDTCEYETNIEQSMSVAGGDLRQGTLEWIDDSIKAIKLQNPQAHFVTVLHHNLFMHHRFFNDDFVIKNAESVARLFAELGLTVFFSGHIHIQHILSKALGNDNVMTEIVNGAQIVYPVAYGVAEFDRSGMQYHKQNVNMRRYADAQGLTDENLLNFEDYSKEVFNRSSGFITKRFEALEYSADDVRAAADTIDLLNQYLFEGRVDEISEEVRQSRGYQVIKETGVMLDYADSILEDALGEHNSIEITW